MKWQLRDQMTGNELREGDEVLTFRNERVKILALFPPETILSGLGRVQVEQIEDRGDDKPMVHIRRLYPSAIGAAFWTDDPHRGSMLLHSIPKIETVHLPEEATS